MKNPPIKNDPSESQGGKWALKHHALLLTFLCTLVGNDQIKSALNETPIEKLAAINRIIRGETQPPAYTPDYFPMLTRIYLLEKYPPAGFPKLVAAGEIKMDVPEEFLLYGNGKKSFESKYLLKIHGYQPSSSRIDIYFENGKKGYRISWWAHTFLKLHPDRSFFYIVRKHSPSFQVVLHKLTTPE
jgi:hypothetical protein